MTRLITSTYRLAAMVFTALALAAPAAPAAAAAGDRHEGGPGKSKSAAGQLHGAGGPGRSESAPGHTEDHGGGAGGGNGSTAGTVVSSGTPAARREWAAAGGRTRIDVDASPDGGLPFTGGAPLLLFAVGLVALIAGLALRRTAARIPAF